MLHHTKAPCKATLDMTIMMHRWCIHAGAILLLAFLCLVLVVSSMRACEASLPLCGDSGLGPGAWLAPLCGQSLKSL